jgi:hypothetical protein
VSIYPPKLLLLCLFTAASSVESQQAEQRNNSEITAKYHWVADRIADPKNTNSFNA